MLKALVVVIVILAIVAIPLTGGWAVIVYPALLFLFVQTIAWPVTIWISAHVIQHFWLNKIPASILTFVLAVGVFVFCGALVFVESLTCERRIEDLLGMEADRHWRVERLSFNGRPPLNDPRVVRIKVGEGFKRVAVEDGRDERGARYAHVMDTAVGVNRAGFASEPADRCDFHVDIAHLGQIVVEAGSQRIRAKGVCARRQVISDLLETKVEVTVSNPWVSGSVTYAIARISKNEQPEAETAVVITTQPWWYKFPFSLLPRVCATPGISVEAGFGILPNAISPHTLSIGFGSAIALKAALNKP